MKKYAIFFIFSILLMSPLPAQNLKIGVGSMLGEPTGINVKIWSSRSYDWETVINHFGKYASMWWASKSIWLPKTNAWSFSAGIPLVVEGDAHLSSDYLWHLYDLFPPELGIMPLYYGFGARVLIKKEHHIGIRCVTGVSYYLIELPIDVFFELAPVVDIQPEVRFDLNVVVGIRYFF